MNKPHRAGWCWGGRVGGLVAGGLVGAAGILGLRAEEDLVTIDFRNRIPGVLDARVYDFDGMTPLEGPLFAAQLYFSTTSTNELLPVGVTVGFLQGTNAGYWGYAEDICVCVIPPTQPTLGQPIIYQVRVYQWIPGGPFGRYVIVGASRVHDMTVTNRVMPLIGFESFRLLPEKLQVRREGDHVVVQWPYLAARRYVLEATTNLQSTASWMPVFEWSSYGDPWEIISVTNALASTPRFYRLERWR